jgi:tRNA A37 threonylcarbamoyladenosine synthetase subunit TsaC/SUA5/YrdC
VTFFHSGNRSGNFTANHSGPITHTSLNFVSSSTPKRRNIIKKKTGRRIKVMQNVHNLHDESSLIIDGSSIENQEDSIVEHIENYRLGSNFFAVLDA